jgi:murein endopeptidase
MKASNSPVYGRLTVALGCCAALGVLALCDVLAAAPPMAVSADIEALEPPDAVDFEALDRPLLDSMNDSAVSLVPPTTSVEDALPLDMPSDLAIQPAPEPTPDAAPDIATLRHYIETDPHALGSLSIGAPDAGALFNGVTLTDGPLWHFRNPDETWATEETLAYLIAAIEAVDRRHPGSPSLCIGDLSKRGGGPLNRHRSHQSGRDVDIGFYYRSGEAPDFRVGRISDLDLPRCWTLVRALVTETDVERIFIDRSIQRALFRHALESGDNRAWLEWIFEYPRGRRDAIIQHERRHRSHLHARFYNPRAQEWGRVAYPLLVDADLAPPPVVMHRARRGDTISTIARRYGTSVAAVKRANGLRSSFIRAGRRYRVPARLASVAAAPTAVVPPRRLPPPAAVLSARATE